ncbi:DNA primase [Niastella caeni]|uniref:DNA primase n=1 Tax=Niastella caeni TaxID=2569763 RepID=UPI00140E901F|nr:DNA primase [Niastella caeni]
MRLSENSIQQVREASIVDVIKHYIPLKHVGSNWKGVCPFHDEKTPSFTVNDIKGVYKCFGCGAGGDAIGFIISKERVEFYQAVEMIAKICSIPLEYEEVPDKEKFEKQKSEREKLKQVVRYTVERYKESLWNLPDEHPVLNYLYNRNITRQLIAEWQLGWATEEWSFISTDIINKGWYDQGSKLGIIKRTASGDRNYDGYRSRITIPITNKYGEYIGMGGRFFEIDSADKGKDFPKYINPPENELYNKSSVLFGLSRADKAISYEGFAFLVEGYFDVISLHANKDSNTVGTCGTALTDQQAVLLRKYTNHVAVLRDGDDAGRKATVKDLLILLRAGFKVDVILLPKTDDPDSYTQKLIANHYRAGTVEIYDGVMWQIDMYMKYVANDEFKLGKAQEAVLNILMTIPNEIIRNNYFDSIIKKYKWQKSNLQKQLNLLIEKEQNTDEDTGESNLDKMPKWMDKEQFLQQGYCIVNNNKRTGYYSFGSGGQIEITNFIIKPLFHIYAGKESRHLIQIDNGRKKAVLDIESKALVSIDLLQQYVVCEGPYIIYGNKGQMLRIATNLLGQFPRCNEVKFLGWQTPGFFAFVDKIYIPGSGLYELDEWGILKFGDQNYLVPAASAAYRELQATGEDPYENDRYLTFIKTDLNFSSWASLMNRVFLEKGPVAIAYVILTIFRDVVFDVDNNCPHLYGFGERSSGKSKWAESVMALFYKKRPAFNLNSGTDFAFFSYMQRFINAPAALNEFDEKVIKPEWFQAIKGIFDGEGRQRGVMGSKNRTEIMKIRSTVILIGQYLCTMDDNSIVSRSIIEGFNERELSEEDKKQYDKLKKHEDAGLSNILIEILQHRQFFKEKYSVSFNANLSEWRKKAADSGKDGAFNQRVVQNWCHLFTCWQLIANHIILPISNKSFESYCFDKGMQWSSFMKSSDTLSEFWNTVSFLVDQGMVIDGWDYKIETTTQIRIRNGRKEEYTHPFNEPTKIVYMRMNNIHKHYQQAYRTRTGKEGMTMENLLHYFSSRKYFLGASKQSRFKRWVTKTENVTRTGGLTTTTIPETHKVEESIVSSSYVFLYEDLGLDIERDQVQEEFNSGTGYVPIPDADFDDLKDNQGSLPFN